MYKRASIILIVLISASAASAQPVEELDASTGFSILGRHRFERPVPQSAEEAEDLAAAGQRPERIWLRSEYLLWWIKTASLPTLVTTANRSDISTNTLDATNTRPRFGGATGDFQERGGGRFTFGWWFDDNGYWAIVGSYFFLNGRSLGETISSPGNPIVARPFTNVLTGRPDASLVAYPGIISGSVEVNIPSFLQGAELNLSTQFVKESARLQLLGGFRFVNLDDGLHIGETTRVALAPQFKNMGIPNEGRTIHVVDRFDTRNDFYGGQLGFDLEWKRGRFSLDYVAKVALGVSREVVTIGGTTSINGQQTANAGLLALSTNSGRHTRNAFAVVPETTFNINFALTNHLRLFAGYSFLYWSSVVRPWDHVDTNVNPNSVPTSTSFGGGGPTLPAFTFHSTSFFAHGATFGMEFRY